MGRKAKWHSYQGWLTLCEASMRRVRARMRKEDRNGKPVSVTPVGAQRCRQHGAVVVLDSSDRSQGPIGSLSPLILPLHPEDTKACRALALLWRGSLAKMASLIAGLVLIVWMVGEFRLIGFQAPIQVCCHYRSGRSWPVFATLRRS